MKKVILISLSFFLLLTNCDHKTISKKEDINDELKKVILEIKGKEKIIAGELKQEDIRAHGFNANIYAVQYEKIEAYSDKQEAYITVSLKKAGTESASKIFTINGFKVPEQNISAQELINIEADKVILNIPNIENISFDELTTDKIIASGYKQDYTIEYNAKKYNLQTKEAEISFYLTKDNLRSKINTLKLNGFKETVLPEGLADIKEEDLCSALSLTETKITASAAAKKIKEASNKTIADFIFEENTILNYDDKRGTFTVYIKGTFKEKPFSKKMRISGFSHPYRNQPESVYKKDLDFTLGIEENLLIDDYIQKANADIKKAFKEGLSFMLHKGHMLVNEIIVLGEHDSYNMTAKLEKIDDSSLKIIPILNIKYKIKTDTDGIEKEEIDTFSLARFLQPVKYFTEKDVYDHILNQLNNPEDFINIDPSRFASEFYAKAMVLKRTPNGLFKDSAIEKYNTLYTKANPDKYLKLDGIGIELSNLNNENIIANDYEGSLRITYYIASYSLIAEPEHANFAMQQKTIKVTGFRTVNEETIKDLFPFAIAKGKDNKGKIGTLSSWRKKYIDEASYLVKEGGSAGEENWLIFSNTNLAKENSSGFVLSLSGDADLHRYLATPDKQFLSTGRNGESILVKHIGLKKDINNDYLEIKMYFLGAGKPITLITNPYIPKN